MKKLKSSSKITETITTTYSLAKGVNLKVVTVDGVITEQKIFKNKIELWLVSDGEALRDANRNNHFNSYNLSRNKYWWQEYMNLNPFKFYQAGGAFNPNDLIHFNMSNHTMKDLELKHLDQLVTVDVFLDPDSERNGKFLDWEGLEKFLKGNPLVSNYRLIVTYDESNRLSFDLLVPGGWRDRHSDISGTSIFFSKEDLLDVQQFYRLDKTSSGNEIVVDGEVYVRKDSL